MVMVADYCEPSCAEVESVDLFSPSFSPRLVGNRLAQLWAVKGGRLVTATDPKGAPKSICPITLSAVTKPVLLSDGVVYEEFQILQWLQENNRAPCTNQVLEHRKVLQLAPFRDALEQFLLANEEIGCTPAQRLNRVVKRVISSQEPLHCRVGQLQTAISRSAQEVDELKDAMRSAEALLRRLRGDLCSHKEAMAMRIQAAVRGYQARSRVARICIDAEKVNKRHRAATTIQAHVRSFFAAKDFWRLRSEGAELRVLAARTIQHCWREHKRLQAKITKKRVLRQKARTKKKTTPQPATEETTPALVTPNGDIVVQKKSGTLAECKINGVMQQFVCVAKKEMRAVLCFVLYQFTFNGECNILILVRNAQEAAGLKTSLSLCPSACSSSTDHTGFTLITGPTSEADRARNQKCLAGIIPFDLYLSSEVDISFCVNLIVFDMPDDMTPFLERASKSKSVTYFSTTPEGSNLLRDMEAKHNIQMREFFLDEIVRDQRKTALKLKMASFSNKRTRK